MRTRRGNREGSFRHRRRVAVDGRVIEDRWEGRVMVAGLGRYSVFAKTRDEARRALVERLDQLEAGIRPPDALLTVGDWIDEWLATSQDRLAARTYESYGDTVRLYIRPALGAIPLSRLSPGHVSRLLATKARDPKLNATIRTVRALVVRYRPRRGHAHRARPARPRWRDPRRAQKRQSP